MNSAINDLKIAERLLEEMAECTNFSVLEEKWQYFLMRLERIWDTVNSSHSKHKKYQAWAVTYNKLRKKDPLLRYLHQARHAEIHSVGGTITKPLHLMIKDKYGRSFSMRELTVEMKDGKGTINLNTWDVLMDYKLEVIPTDPSLVRFKNRGRWYNPPCTHLGNTIPSLHPCFVAKFALDFYSSFITSAEHEFCKQEAEAS